jgi:hypothetical protein
MDQQPHGNFIAFMNRDKQPGDNKPTFDGRLAVPGTEDEMRFALWAHEYPHPKSGEMQIMFNGTTGNVATSATAMEQVAALIKASPNAGQADATIGNLKLAPRQLVLFPNGFKAEAPEKNRPDYWGLYNPGNGEPVVRISAWAKKDRNLHAMLAGATSYPIPGKSEVQQQDAAPELKDLVESGAVTQGMPKTKARLGRGARA